MNNSIQLKHGDKAILEVSGVGKGEVDIVETEGELYVDDDHYGLRKLEELQKRSDVKITKLN